MDPWTPRLILRSAEPNLASQAECAFTLEIDGARAGGDASVAPNAWRRLRSRVRDLADLMEREPNGSAAAALAREVGSKLFDAFFAPWWASHRLDQATGWRLAVLSEDVDLVNMPWELLLPQGSGAVGLDVRWAVRRSSGLAAAITPPSQGPLRILASVSAPAGLAELDHEREEERLQEAVLGSGSLELRVTELGSLAELAETTLTMRPHVVHLAGHGRYSDQGGQFAFEDPRGGADWRSAAEVAAVLLEAGVLVIFVSACGSGRAGTASAHGLAQGLHRAGIPFAIGWSAAINDNLATEVAGAAYGALAQGESIDEALTAARRAAETATLASGDLSWSQLVLYAGEAADFRTAQRPAARPVGAVTGAGLAGPEDAGLLVGRRRDLQRMTSDLKSGATRALWLAGAAGVGKTALARRVVDGLEADGFAAVRLSYDPATPITDQILRALPAEDGQLALGADHTLGRGASRASRLQSLVAALRRRRLAILIDSVDMTSLGEAWRGTVADAASLLEPWLKGSASAARLIFVSRLTPALQAPGLRVLQLGEFGPAAAGRFLLRDPAVRARHGAGYLDEAVLTQLHAIFGGTPQDLLQVRAALRTATRQDIEALGREATDGATPTRMSMLLVELTQQATAGIRVSALPAEAARLLGGLVLLRTPLPLRDVAAIARAPVSVVEAAAQVWSEAGLAYPVTDAPGSGWLGYAAARRALGAATLAEPATFQAAAAEHLVKLEAEGRAGAIGLTDEQCLGEALRLRLAAGALDGAREVAGVMAGRLAISAKPDEVRRLHDNLLAVAPHPMPACWIARALRDHGAYAEAARYYDLALALAGDAEPTWADTALDGLGMVALKRGDFVSARRYFERCVELARTSGDRPSEALALAQIGGVDLAEGRFRAARLTFIAALRKLRRAGDAFNAPAVRHQLGSIALHTGSYRRARAHLTAALSGRRAVHDEVGEGQTLHQLACVDLEEGRFDAARLSFEQTLAFKRRAKDRDGEAACLISLAMIDLNQGLLPAAREGFEAALRISEAHGLPVRAGAILRQLGSIALKQGAYSEAQDHLRRSIHLHEAIGDASGRAESLTSLGVVDLELGRFETARRKFVAGLKVFKALGHRPGIAAVLTNLGGVATRRRQWRLAQRRLEEALVLWTDLGAQTNRASVLHELGTVDIANGRLTEARSKLEAAVQIRNRQGARLAEASSIFQLATIDLLEEHDVDALEKLIQVLTVRQEAGAQSAEAAVWQNLGVIAIRAGRTVAGLHLLALCYLLEEALGVVVGALEAVTLETIANGPQYNGPALREVLAAAAEAYETDRGASLLLNAFPAPHVSGHPSPSSSDSLGTDTAPPSAS